MKVGGAWQVDGGIPTLAWPHFCAWMAAIRRAKIQRLIDPLAFAKMYALPEFATYRLQRDWTEFERVGKVRFRSWVEFFKSNDPQIYLLGLTFGSNLSGHSKEGVESFPEKLDRTYDTVEAMGKRGTGRDRLLKTADQLMKAPKVADGRDVWPGYRRLVDSASRDLGCTQVYVEACFWRELVSEVAHICACRHDGAGAPR